jgi:hypothetical protein
VVTSWVNRRGSHLLFDYLLASKGIATVSVDARRTLMKMGGCKWGRSMDSTDGAIVMEAEKRLS